MVVRGLVFALMVSLSAGALGACGDDTAGDGGGDGGSTDAGADTGAPPAMLRLADGVAGKACSGSVDCGDGTCATMLRGDGLAAESWPAVGGYCTLVCDNSAQCGAGGVCIGALPPLVSGQCRDVCNDADDPCREGYVCGGGISIGGIEVPDSCAPAPQTDQLEGEVAGNACTADGDCGGGQCLLERQTLSGNIALPGGYCTGACLEDGHCGAGGVCLPSLLGGAGSCYRGCSSDPDCQREGYRCRPLRNELRGCNPAAQPLPPNTTGSPCTEDVDCGGNAGACAMELPVAGVAGVFGQTRGALDGYCTQPCLEDVDCGAGGICVGGGLGTGGCYKPCEADGECREGYFCEQRGSTPAQQDGGVDEPITVCAPVPPPSDADAGSG